MRNDWTGHGGVVSQDEAKLRNEQLKGEVQRLREALADVWREVHLIRHSIASRERTASKPKLQC